MATWGSGGIGLSCVTEVLSTSAFDVHGTIKPYERFDALVNNAVVTIECYESGYPKNKATATFSPTRIGKASYTFDYSFTNLLPGKEYVVTVDLTVLLSGEITYLAHKDLTATTTAFDGSLFTKNKSSSVIVTGFTGSALEYATQLVLSYKNSNEKGVEYEAVETYEISENVALDLSHTFSALKSGTKHYFQAILKRKSDSRQIGYYTLEETTPVYLPGGVPQPYIEYVKVVPTWGRAIIKYSINQNASSLAWGTDITLHLYESSDGTTFTDKETLSVYKTGGLLKRYHVISENHPFIGVTKYYKLVVVDANQEVRYETDKFTVSHVDPTYTNPSAGDPVQLTATEMKTVINAVLNKAYYYIGYMLSTQIAFRSLDDKDFEMTYEEAKEYVDAEYEYSQYPEVNDVAHVRLVKARLMLLEYTDMTGVAQGRPITGAWQDPDEDLVTYVYETPWDNLLNLCLALQSSPWTIISGKYYPKSTTRGTTGLTHLKGDIFKATDYSTLITNANTALGY